MSWDSDGEKPSRWYLERSGDGDAERLPAAICWATQKPPEECPRGLDQCEGEVCDEYFIAYGV